MAVRCRERSGRKSWCGQRNRAAASHLHVQAAHVRQRAAAAARRGVHGGLRDAALLLAGGNADEVLHLHGERAARGRRALKPRVREPARRAAAHADPKLGRQRRQLVLSVERAAAQRRARGALLRSTRAADRPQAERLGVLGRVRAGRGGRRGVRERQVEAHLEDGALTVAGRGDGEVRVVVLAQDLTRDVEAEARARAPLLAPLAHLGRGAHAAGAGAKAAEEARAEVGRPSRRARRPPRARAQRRARACRTWLKTPPSRSLASSAPSSPTPESVTRMCTRAQPDRVCADSEMVTTTEPRASVNLSCGGGAAARRAGPEACAVPGGGRVEG